MWRVSGLRVLNVVALGLRVLNVYRVFPKICVWFRAVLGLQSLGFVKGYKKSS